MACIIIMSGWRFDDVCYDFSERTTNLRSTHVPQKGHSETIGDNQTNLQTEGLHYKYSVFRGFWWSVMV